MSIGTLPLLSANETKRFASLKVGKYRDREALFISEGRKVTFDLATQWSPECLIIDESSDIDQLEVPNELISKVKIATTKQFKQISSLESTREVIGIFAKPSYPIPTEPITSDRLSIALDTLQDPGNLGTIIRLCDWLGIDQIFCGEGTVDPFNPKVVQATAGTLANVKIYQHCNLSSLLPQLFHTVLATDMNGEPIRSYCTKAQESGRTATCLVMGNEGHGISEDIKSICNHTVSIPAASSSCGDSLNVGISAAILLAALADSSDKGC